MSLQWEGEDVDAAAARRAAAERAALLEAAGSHRVDVDDPRGVGDLGAGVIGVGRDATACDIGDEVIVSPGTGDDGRCGVDARTASISPSSMRWPRSLTWKSVRPRYSSSPPPVKRTRSPVR